MSEITVSTQPAAPGYINAPQQIAQKKMHPELVKVQEIWLQIRILKQENRQGYEGFMLPLPLENNDGRKDRVRGFVKGFINPTQMLLRSKGDAIFKKPVQRKNPSASQAAFIDTVDRSGQSLNEIMHNEVAPSLAGYGTVFAVLDKPGVTVTNKEEELASKLPYMTILDPLQVIDFAWDKDGKLLWFQYLVDAPVDNSDPWKPKRDPKWKAARGVATWTRTTYDVRSMNGKQVFVQPIDHGFGFVPVVIQTQYVEPSHTVGLSTFFTSSDYLIMGNNLNNCADNEVFKNANTTLAVHDQDWDDDQQPQHERSPDTNQRILNKTAHDFKNVFLYSTNKPEFLARDLDLIDKAGMRADKYFDLAIDNEKSTISAQTATAPDQPAQPASGVSKAYDFVDVNAMLASTAAALQRFEGQALSMVAEMMDESDAVVVEYPKEFDVRSYNQRLEFVKGLIAAQYPSKQGLAEAYKMLTGEITQDVEEAAEINAELDAWAGEAEDPADEKKETPPPTVMIAQPKPEAAPAAQEM